MNALLLNRDGGFVMPADGWYQVAPLGEFAHAQAGVVQVVDRAACESMANRFGEEAKGANFAGLLIDFDHFSLDGEKKSEAAGWVTALEARCPVGSEQLAVGSREAGENRRVTNVEPQNHESGNGAGLWAQIRWSDVGEEAVKGGRYRFLSPVWRRGDCEDLGNGRVRPMRLHNAAVTNDPNLKGLRPLSNRSRETGDGKQETGGERPTPNAERLTPNGESTRMHREHKTGATGENGNVDFLPGGEGKIVNGGLNAEMLEWMLGDGDDHCPGCAALAGQVHSREAWEAAGVLPGGGKTYCGEDCRCRLEPTDKGERGELGGVPLRKEKKMENSVNAVGSGQLAVGSGENEKGSRGGAEARSGERSTLNAQRSTPKDGLANIGWTDVARAASLAVRRAKAAARRAKESLSGKDGKKARENVKEKLDGYVEAAIDAYVDEYGRQPTTDAEIAEAEEMSGMPEAYRTNGEPISEEALIDRILERGDEADEPAGEPLDEEPVYTTPGFPSDGGGTQDGAGDNDNWGWFLDEGLAGMSGDSIAEMAGEVAAKVAGGGELSELEQSFAEALTQKAAGLVEKVWRGERLTDEEKVIIQSLKGVVKPPAVANRGWTDAARRASLAVRQAKAAARKARESGDAGQSAVSGEQSAVSGEDGGNETPVPPEGGGQEDGFAEKRSQMAAEIEDWYRRAYDAFVEKKGREPLSDEDVIEAEELAGVPEKYRTGGDDVQALVVADQVLWDQEEKERGESPEGSGEVANVGWTDAARRAALAVRRAKAAARKAREVGGGEHERAGTPVPPGGDEGETKDDYNPHWPVYRRPVIQPRGEPGEATMPPEFRRPPPGRPIPIYKLFRRENVDKLRRGEGR